MFLKDNNFYLKFISKIASLPKDSNKKIYLKNRPTFQELTNPIFKDRSNPDLYFENFIKCEFKNTYPNYHRLTTGFDTFRFLYEQFDNLEFYYILDNDSIVDEISTSNSGSSNYNISAYAYTPEDKSFYTLFKFKDYFFEIKNFTISCFYLDNSEFYRDRERLFSDLIPYVRKIEKQSNIFMVSRDQDGYWLADFKVSDFELDVNLNYNDDFVDVNKVIIDKLKNSFKGIVFLHGKPGTGKTFYIRHLIKNINKKFVFIPSHLSFNLTETSFLNFLVESCKESVLILEDAEKLISSRLNSSPTSVSDLLNLTDGLMSDILKIQVVCTFNTDITNIDSAFLRKGRLIAEYEFQELSYLKAELLAKKLNKKLVEVKEYYTLAELYNLHDNTPLVNKEKIKLGF